ADVVDEERLRPALDAAHATLQRAARARELELRLVLVALVLRLDVAVEELALVARGLRRDDHPHAIDGLFPARVVEALPLEPAQLEASFRVARAPLRTRTLVEEAAFGPHLRAGDRLARRRVDHASAHR